MCPDVTVTMYVVIEHQYKGRYSVGRALVVKIVVILLGLILVILLRINSHTEVACISCLGGMYD